MRETVEVMSEGDSRGHVCTLRTAADVFNSQDPLEVGTGRTLEQNQGSLEKGEVMLGRYREGCHVAHRKCN